MAETKAQAQLFVTEYSLQYIVILCLKKMHQL